MCNLDTAFCSSTHLPIYCFSLCSLSRETVTVIPPAKHLGNLCIQQLEDQMRKVQNREVFHCPILADMNLESPQIKNEAVTQQLLCHLSKPNGAQEHFNTLEDISQDLAAEELKFSDYFTDIVD